MRVLLLAAACCGAPPPPPAISNSKPAITLSGTVTDQANAPIGGVTVLVNHAGHAPNTEQPVAQEITDEHGRYRIDSLPAGRYDVHLYYTDISVMRTAEVQGQTILDQQIDAAWMSNGVEKVCAASTAASCK